MGESCSKSSALGPSAPRLAIGQSMTKGDVVGAARIIIRCRLTAEVSLLRSPNQKFVLSLRSELTLKKRHACSWS